MNFQIQIDNLSHGGLAPRFYEHNYPTFGNKNNAGKMLNCDLTNANYIQQGAGLANLTDGTETGAVTTLIKGMTDYAVTDGVAYGVGGAKLYRFSNTAVVNTGAFPRTIDKGTVTGEDGEDVALYLGNLYYSYNHSGSAGDVGKYNLDATFDDDFFSAGVAGGGAHALEGGVPHQMASTVNQLLYVANGRYIAEYNGVTDILTYNKLDFPTGWVVSSIKWVNNRLWMAVNKTSLTGLNKNRASLFVWDGTTDNPESEIELSGTVGGIYVKNAILYVFYQDVTNTGGYKLAYVNGSQVVDLANFTGDLPDYYQISEYKDFIIWNSNGDLYAWGSGDKELPVRFFQIADGGYSTVGGIACPFGTPIIASNESTSYKLAQWSGYDTNSYWKSLMFDITGTGKTSSVESVRVNFEQLESGAYVTLNLVNNRGVTIHTEVISYARLGAVTTHYIPLNGKIQENFRVEFNYTGGSTSATVKIKSVRIKGTIN
jgi:hypothetical protein